MRARAAWTDIDWQQVHARLARTAAAMRDAGEASPEHAARLLDERARRLSKPLAAPLPAGAMLDLLAFELAGERYAIETRHVQEVVRAAGVTPVPGVPDVVAGLANLRGQILIVFDLRPLLGLATADATEASRIVVFGDAESGLGLVVDCASAVFRLPADDIQPTALADADAGGRLVRGVARDATIVLDGSALLDDSRLSIDQPRRQ